MDLPLRLLQSCEHIVDVIYSYGGEGRVTLICIVIPDHVADDGTSWKSRRLYIRHQERESRGRDGQR